MPSVSAAISHGHGGHLVSGKPRTFFPTAVSRGYMYAERVLCCEMNVIHAIKQLITVEEVSRRCCSNIGGCIAGTLC